MNILSKIKHINKDKNLLIIRNNFLSLSILQIMNMFLPLLILPFLVKNLGLTNFGLLIFSQAFVAFFTIIIDFGFNISATRRISLHKNDPLEIAKIFYSVFFIKFLLLLCSTLLISIIIFTFDIFSENYLLHYITFSMIVGQILLPIWYFQGIENMKMIAILNVIIKLSYTLMIFLFISSNNDLLYVASFNSISFIIIGVIGFYLAFKDIVSVSFESFDANYIITFFKESGIIFISNFFSGMYAISNTFLLGLFTDNSLVGIYSSFEKLVTALKSLYMPLFQALFPYVSRSKNKRNIIKKLLLPIFMSGLFISLISYYYSGFIINTIYSNKDLINNLFYFNYMIIIPLLASVNMLFNFLYLNSMKMYRIRMYIMISAGITNFIIAIILLELNFEILSVVISYILTEFLLLILGILTYKYYKVKNEI